MLPEEHKKLLDRLARVEGQVRGLRKMLEEQRCCEDVLTQLLAARSGLEKAGLLVLDHHLEDCVFDADVNPRVAGEVREALRLWQRHAAPVD
ncbi:MAG TPA: metal-sensitive transcriptional regulator [Dehalococcoidia bacterium]|nr:metal-sensitive transcriptional regulator [Dehalococcoidia bacterium]